MKRVQKEILEAKKIKKLVDIQKYWLFLIDKSKRLIFKEEFDLRYSSTKEQIIILKFISDEYSWISSYYKRLYWLGINEYSNFYFTNSEKYRWKTGDIINKIDNLKKEGKI